MTFDDTIDLVQLTLRENGVSNDLIAKTIKNLKQAAAEEKADRAATSGKKPRSQYVVVSTTPGLGYVIQMEAEAAPTEVTTRIQAAATDFNNSRKGRRVPVSTVGETLENVPARFFKTTDGKKCAVKTKSAVTLLTVPNALAL